MSYVLTPTSPIVYSSTEYFPPTYDTVVPVPGLTSPMFEIRYQKPIIDFYDTLNVDPAVQKRMIKHVYYLFLDKWLYRDLSDILNYFVIRDGKVSMILSMKDYDPKRVDKDTQADIEKKADYIGQHILKKSDMGAILYKFVKETGTKWYDLPQNDYFLRGLVEKSVKKVIKDKLA